MRLLDTKLGSAPVSTIGFGCASFGSRVSAREASAALERAFDAGISWYDVAPSYGDGNAEAILGRFAARHRDTINICTKVGIVADKAGWKVLLRPLARTMVKTLPGLRRYATRARAVTNPPLTSAGIAASVDRSLTLLGVERIDLLMLHDPAPDDVLREDIAEALRKLIAAGKVAAVGVAGHVEAASAGATKPELFSALQFANNPFEPNGEAEFVTGWRAAGKLIITHSSLGAYGALPRLTRALAADKKAYELLIEAGYHGEPTAMAAAFLTDYALATNTKGIALFSAARAGHLHALLTRDDNLRDLNQMRTLAGVLANRTPTPA